MQGQERAESEARTKELRWLVQVKGGEKTGLLATARRMEELTGLEGLWEAQERARHRIKELEEQL